LLAWHFLKEDRKLRFPPYTEITPGSIVTAEGELKMCRNGCHASIKPLDALQYAPGPIVCRVELSGEIIEDTDKLCARHRKVIWMADATRTLHEFACWCAEQALLRERAAGREPDPRCWEAIEAKRRWLRGEITDSDLAAARVAAWEAALETTLEAAHEAARAAKQAASWAAARAVARETVRAATRAATQGITRVAVWDTAWDAVWDEQNAKLEEMLLELGREAQCAGNQQQTTS